MHPTAARPAHLRLPSLHLLFPLLLPLLLLLLLSSAPRTASGVTGKSSGPSASVKQKACQESAKNMLLLLYKQEPTTAGIYMSTSAYLNIMAWCASTKGNVTVFCPTDDSFTGKFAPSTDSSRLRAILATMTLPEGYRSMTVLKAIKPGTQIMTTSGRPIVAQGSLMFRGLKPNQYNGGTVKKLGYQDSWVTVYIVQGLMLPDFL